MFCEKCGTKLEEGSLFCEKCGARVQAAAPEVEGTPAAEAAPAPQPVPMYNQQAAPQYQQPYQQAPMYNQQMAPLPPSQVVPKKPMAKSVKILILEAILLAAMIFVVFQVGSTRFGAKYAAETYAKAKMANDWDALFDMLNLPSSGLLTKEMFLQTRTEDDLLEVTNYALEDGSDMKNDFRRTYRCEYMTNGNSYSNSEDIQVVKQREKQFLVFDKWEVTPDNMLAEDVTFTVPLDATLKLNGVDVSTIGGVKSEESYGYRVYSLPAMFSGTYTIQVEAPMRQTVGEVAYIGSYYSMSYTDMYLDPAVVESLGEKSAALHQDFVTAQMEGKSYQDFAAGLNLKEGTDFSWCYDDFAYYIVNNENYLYNKYEISNVVAKMDDYGKDYNTNNLYVSIRLYGDVTAEGTRRYEDWWTGKVTYEPYTYTDGYYGYCTYELINGEWALSYFSN